MIQGSWNTKTSTKPNIAIDMLGQLDFEIHFALAFRGISRHNIDYAGSR